MTRGAAPAASDVTFPKSELFIVQVPAAVVLTRQALEQDQ